MPLAVVGRNHTIRRLGGCDGSSSSAYGRVFPNNCTRPHPDVRRLEVSRQELDLLIRIIIR